MSHVNKNISVIHKYMPGMKIYHKIYDGKIDPESLSEEMRKEVIEYMLMNLSPVSIIANNLHMDIVMVMRYKREINRRNSVKPSPYYMWRMALDVMEKQDRLLKQIKSKDGSFLKKAWATYCLVRNVQKVEKILMSFGYLSKRLIKNKKGRKRNRRIKSFEPLINRKEVGFRMRLRRKR